MLRYTLVVITPPDILAFDPLSVSRRALFYALARPFSESFGADTAAVVCGRTGGHWRVDPEELVRDVERYLCGFQRVGESAGFDPVTRSVLHYFELEGRDVGGVREDMSFVCSAVVEVFGSALVVGCCDAMFSVRGGLVASPDQFVDGA